MFWTPTTLPPEVCSRICASLNGRLADGVDLSSQLRVMRWNLQGVAFARVQPMLHVVETDLANRLDQIAERVTSLGGRAFGSARYAAHASRIPEFWAGDLDDGDRVLLACDRITRFLEGVRETRRVCELGGDAESAAMLSALLRDFERVVFTLRGAMEIAAVSPAAESAAIG